MQVDVKKEERGYVGVVTDDNGNFVGVTKRCHDRREARREAGKLTRKVPA